MNDVTERGYTRARRHMVAGAALWLALGVSGAASATTTLQDMFNGGSFTQDNLVFSDFKPVLNDSLPSVNDVLTQVMTDPQGLTGLPVLDFDSTGVFSRAVGNANPAIAQNIEFVVLPDDAGTTGAVDPGFRLDGGTQWQVDAGNIASAQLSAFAYTVSKTPAGKQINSAGVMQSSTIGQLGPDSSSLDPFSLALALLSGQVPDLGDFAGASVFQFILDPGSTDLSTALVNYTLDGGIRDPRLSPFLQGFLQFEDWEAFADRDTLQVVTLVGIGATSGGTATMGSVSQRIDPPPPNAIPEPGVLLLMGVGMLGVGAWRRRSSGRLPGIA